ncbi:protein phosphatase 1 regulatory subunit 3A-like [Dunckerocampus dactyliophorus]|uniref:protein phosphatase 1 regulatory subunit 3A-like n=1 Tax=Dunckerocampus dactyliophorus TaxID=161453 RepID=UPI0024057B9A|nr:protein phosphatase 1 regulatory subunit 3A-like [Dunckerocampus dactyliophorus]
MESQGQSRPSGAYSLLVPGLDSPDVDEDDGEVVIGIRPKSSPLPRRRSSVTDEDSEPDSPPPSASRRVSFADAKGLSLVQVKEFDLWDVPKLPGFESQEDDIVLTEDYFLSPLTFHSPLSPEDLLVRVQEQKIELESLELIPGTSTLKGVIRVLNLSFHKAVYVRTTLDGWASHFDLLTEYSPGSDNPQMDCFTFKLTLVPPFLEQGSRLDFCLRYETPLGTFWANNGNRNYVVLCQQRVKQTEIPQKEMTQKKSCLKTISQNYVENSWETPLQENLSSVVPTTGEKDDSGRAVRLPDAWSEEDGKNLQAENRRNCSRKKRRKAARMARVKDYFSQRDGATLNDPGDVSPPEDKTVTKEEISIGNQENVQKENRKLGDSFSDEVLMEHKMKKIEPETPLDVCVASLPGGDRSRDMSNPEPPPAEHFNMFEAEGAVFENSHLTLPEETAPHTEEEDASTEREALQENTDSDSTQECFDISVNVPLLAKDACNGPEVLEDVSESQASGEISINKSDVVAGGSQTTPPTYLPVSEASGETQKDTPLLSPSQLDHDNVDHQAGSDLAEDAEASNDPGVINYTAINEHENICNSCVGPEEEEVVEIPQTFPQTPEEPCKARPDFHEVEVGGKDAEPITFNRSHLTKNPNEETFGYTENIEVKDREMMNKEEEMKILPDEEGQKHDHLIEETEAVTSTEAEELVPSQSKIKTGEEEHVESVMFEDFEATKLEKQAGEVTQRTSETLQDFVKMEEGKMEVEMLEKVDDEDEVVTDERDEDMQHSQHVDVEESTQDEVQRLEFSHSKLEDALLNRLHKDDGSRQDAKEELKAVQRLEFDPSKLEDALLNHLQEDDGFREYQSEKPAARTPDETDLQDDGEKTATLHGQDANEEPWSGQTSNESNESDSDDEVELYMHCLRAVHTGARPAKEQQADVVFNPSKRTSISRSKPLSTPMPSISEAADEEHLGCLQESRDSIQAADVHVQPQSREPPSTIRKASWWRETCSCGCISKTLLFATLLVVFVVTAYYYDFLACFGLYLISVVWLLCQGEKHPMKDDTKG